MSANAACRRRSGKVRDVRLIAILADLNVQMRSEICSMLLTVGVAVLQIEGASRVLTENVEKQKLNKGNDRNHAL